MSDKLISIVLPTFNGARFISESIDSILNQTYRNWELIIVNDCSTDNTLEIINEYAKRDGRIKIISNQKNKKLPASLNIGFEYAQGDYYTWTSDDNIYYPEALEYMVKFLNNNSYYDLVCCDYELIEEDGTFKQIHSELYPHNLFELSKNAVVGACFLYTKEIADKIGKYNEKTFCAEDYDYWCRLALAGNIYFSDRVLYKYRFNLQSLTSTKQDLIKEQVYNIRLKYSLKILKKCCAANQQKRQVLLDFYNITKDYRWLFAALKDNFLNFIYIILKTSLFSLFEEFTFVLYIISHKNNNIAFYGASLFLENLIKKYKINSKNIVGIVDKDPKKHGKNIGKYKIYPLEEIKNLNADKIVFTIKKNNEKIYKNLKAFFKENNINIYLEKNLFFK